MAIKRCGYRICHMLLLSVVTKPALGAVLFDG